MEKRILSITTFVLCFFLTGCISEQLNDKEKRIVGKWFIGKTESFEEEDGSVIQVSQVPNLPVLIDRFQ